MSQLIISIGLPGSGKTTVLKPMAEKLGYTYINADEIRHELTGSETDHSMEKTVWELVYERAVEAVAYGGVILDATNTKPKDRVSIIKHLRQYGVGEIVALWFDVPFEIASERNATRERKVPITVLEKMQRRLAAQPPTYAEGFDKILKVAGNAEVK